MVCVKLDVIGRGDGAAERACEAQSTPRTQHIIATAATRALEFESRPGVASVAVLILSAGGGGAINATTPIPADEFSIICLPATEGTHPSTRTATTERVLQPPFGRGRCRGSAYRTAVIKRHWSAAPWPKAAGHWRRPGATAGSECAAPTADVAPKNRTGIGRLHIDRNRTPAHWALRETVGAFTTDNEVPTEQPHAGSPIGAYQA